MKERFFYTIKRKYWFKRILTIIFRSWSYISDVLQHTRTSHQLTVVTLPICSTPGATYPTLKNVEHIILGKFKFSLLLNAIPCTRKRIKYRHYNNIAELCNLALMYAKGKYICYIDTPPTQDQIQALGTLKPQNSSDNPLYILQNGAITENEMEYNSTSIAIYPSAWLRNIGGIKECETPSFHDIALSLMRYDMFNAQQHTSEFRYDIILMPHKKYHAATMADIGKHLLQHGISLAFADISITHGNEGANELEQLLDIPKLSLAKLITSGTMYRALFCMCDWDNGAGMRLINRSNTKGIPTIALVEGVQDFLDRDTFMLRKPYRHAHHILLAGEHDRKYFPPTANTRVVGVPRLFNLLLEPVSFPATPQAIINANFSYGVFSDISQAWVASAVEGCIRAGITYVISQHPADAGDYSAFNVAKEDIYTLIRNGSIVITRFGSTLIEALALGKPVVYHNPHNEEVDCFKDSLGAYSISSNTEELSKSLLRELSRARTVRHDANKFLRLHTNYDSCNPQPQSPIVADALMDILNS